jgi:membrane-bound metal-dependent hydrolase YbcI (DUF457 family)
VDIVTHALMGAVLASPFFDAAPLPAAAFWLGCAAPDLDAVSRVFGKRAFLNAHQTWSHAYPVIAAIGLATWAGLAAMDLEPAALTALGLALGMGFHTLLDWTNTYGITLFAPFSRRRFCAEWVFFIDAFTIAVTLAVLVVLGLRVRDGAPMGWGLQAAWTGGLTAYWVLRGLLRRRAGQLAGPGTLALLPSALVPWYYLGCARDEADPGSLRVFRVDTLRGVVEREDRIPILDAGLDPALLATLEALPEVRAVRGLTPAYHVVEDTRDVETGDRRLRLKDLRTRNFTTRFCELEVVLDGAGQIRERVFHV